MKDVMVKTFEGKQIRTHLDENGDPWFVAQDICDSLGIKNKAHALRKLENDQRGWSSMNTLGGNQDLVTVSESGLYALIFQSRKNEALRFQNWVTREVIPSIRKTGSYSTHRQLTPGEKLRQMADAVIENERAVAAAVKELSVVKTSVVAIDQKVEMVDQKVDTVATTVKQLTMHRRGKDPLPAGTIPLVAIRQRYFFGVSQAVISEYLSARNHPSIHYTFHTDQGADIPSKGFAEAGLLEAYKELIMTSAFVKSTPLKWMFSNALIGNDFGFKKGEVPSAYATLIERRLMPLACDVLPLS